METSLSAGTLPSPPVGVSPKPWGIPAIIFVLVIPAGLLLPNLFVKVPEHLSTADIIAALVSTLVLKDVLFIGMAAGFAIWRYKLGWDALGLRPFDRTIWWVPLVAAAGALALVMAYSALLVLIAGDGAAPKQEDLDRILNNNATLPLAAFSVVIAAPLSEEIFFRGFIFGGLIRPLGVTGAMIASGLLFGAFHVTGLDSLAIVPPFAVVGAFFAWLYYRTGSIYPCIAAHLLFNIVGFTGAVLAN